MCFQMGHSEGCLCDNNGREQTKGDRTMLTVEQLDAMPEGTIFATGIAQDVPEGLFLANTGKELRWVAVRGRIHDWTIYAHHSYHDIEWIRNHGDKVCGDTHIKKCVPCTDEAFALYRF